MATPLDPAPPERRHRFTELAGHARAAVGAGIGTLALIGAVVATPGTALAQDDELAVANTWVTDQIQAPGAWQTTKGEGVTVAVIDTGISEHPFFEDKNIEPGYTVFSDEDDAWNDRDGHGTHVSAGVLYVAPEATILPVRYGTGAELHEQGLTGGAGGEAEVNAIHWAVDNGADVLAMPWGIFEVEPSEKFLSAIQYAIDSGAVVVAGAGNDPEVDALPFPASIPGVVAVSGTDQSGELWYRSTTGAEVVVAAPAAEMTHPAVQQETLGWGDNPEQDLYETGEGGTSLGTGIVSGVIALALAAHPDLDGNNAIQRLIQTAGKSDGGGRTEELGYGLVNADQVVHAENIEAVDENPLGYPLGEPGASEPETDEGATDSEDGAVGSGEPTSSAASAEKSGTGISTIIIVAAAVVLIGAAITVWSVLRGRGRKQALAAGQPGGFVGEQAPIQGGSYPPQQPGPNPLQYGPPPSGGQNFGPPPSGGQQHYSPPMNSGEPSPPWGPGGDPNQRG